MPSDTSPRSGAPAADRQSRSPRVANLAAAAPRCRCPHECRAPGPAPIDHALLLHAYIGHAVVVARSHGKGAVRRETINAWIPREMTAGGPSGLDVWRTLRPLGATGDPNRLDVRGLRRKVTRYEPQRIVWLA